MLAVLASAAEALQNDAQNAAPTPAREEREARANPAGSSRVMSNEQELIALREEVKQQRNEIRELRELVSRFMEQSQQPRSPRKRKSPES